MLCDFDSLINFVKMPLSLLSCTVFTKTIHFGHLIFFIWPSQMSCEAEKICAEESYEIWKKNVPHLYDLVYTNTLKYYTPFIAWFPDVQRLDNSKSVQRLLSTTFSNGLEQEQLLFSQISFPDMVDEDSLNNADIDFKLTQSIPLPVDSNKCKFCPLATNIIACRTEDPDILIYDYTKHSSMDSKKGPDGVLKGHTQGGFALDWSQLKFGQLVTGGRDCLVNVFDINHGLIYKKKYHTGIVNDVSFSRFDPNVFCSVSDDMRIALNDCRSIDSTMVLEKAHLKSIECCSFSPFKSELLATGSSDSTLKIWDIRSLETPLFILRGHSDTLVNCKWSPHYESLLASCSHDKKAIIWDLNKNSIIDGESSPEMMFVHGGHTASVDDIDWNPAEPMEIASVSSDALLHVWKIPLKEFI
jgi:histone-binding protein RBBP4